MTDIVDKKTRSRMMAGIKGKNTQPELIVRHFLHGAGLRYRLHAGKLPGRPDLALPRYHTAVFVHGCFWHRHENCRFSTTPASNPKKWQTKFSDNVARDLRNKAELKKLGWRVITVWECVTRQSNCEKQLNRVVAEIKHGSRRETEWPKKLSGRLKSL